MPLILEDCRASRNDWAPFPALRPSTAPMGRLDTLLSGLIDKGYALADRLTGHDVYGAAPAAGHHRQLPSAMAPEAAAQPQMR